MSVLIDTILKVDIQYHIDIWYGHLNSELALAIREKIYFIIIDHWLDEIEGHHHYQQAKSKPNHYLISI